MRYRQQKTSSVNEDGNGKDTIDMQEFNSITEPLVDPGIQMSIRSKKNQQYVSLNATQNLMNNSLDLSN